MSLHQLANHMSAQGRGPDSTLVHMSPREVSGLQSLAMAHGGTLTINPQTGLPEAGFLDSLMPTLLGGAATFFSGGAITPFMAALGVGGLTALTSKDLGKGLMAGLGAYGGSGIMEGLEGFGAADIGEKAIGAATADAAAAGLQNVPGSSDAYAAAMQKGVGDRMAGATYSDKLKAGFSKALSNPGDAFNAIGGGNKFMGALKVGAPLLSALSSQEATPVPTFEQTKFDPSYANINIRRDQLPYQRDTGSSAQRGYFGPTYVNRNAAEGGFVSDDGIEHFAVGGGIPLDPDYDYSGYGRKKTDVVRPVTPLPDVPKPDFLAADGKTYRYDPIKRSWYVIKDVEAKTNAGVETLMNTGGPGGGQDKAPNTTPNWGATASIGKTLSDLGLDTIGGYLSQQAREGRTAQQGKATDIQDSSRDDTRGPTNPLGGDVTSTPAGFANPLGGDVTSTPAGLASLATAPTAPAAPVTSITNNYMTDKEAAAIINAENTAKVAAAQMQKDQDDGMQAVADREAANAARAAKDFEARYAGIAARAAQDQKEFEKYESDNPTIGPYNPVNTLGGDVISTPAGPDNPMGGDVTSSTPVDAGTVADGFSAPGVDPQGEANGGMVGRYAQGGLGSLGGYSDGGRLLRGPGDGVSDSIPATVGGRQPARLADGEFVVPARIVSELGNGSTEAGARALYKMMDRIQANRRKTTGKNSVAVNSKSHKYLPA